MVRKDVWSVSLGRWFGIPVRLHMFFLLFATFTFYLAWRESSRAPGLTALAAVCLAVLFVSILIHEIAHCFVALRLGGSVDSIVIGPLGGLRPVRVSHDPQSELLAVLAGPLASLMLCLGCLSIVALYDHRSALGLLNPLVPKRVIGDAALAGALEWNTILRLTCWINWWLVVINMIPAFPFDGGRAVQAFIQSVRPGVDKETAVAIAASGARCVAVALVVLAFVFQNQFDGTGMPSWLPLVVLAIFVFFSTRVEESQMEQIELDEAMFGYDFSQGYTSLEDNAKPESVRPREGVVARWLRQRHQLRAQRRQDQERHENERVDEILRRLHLHGYDNLTQEERSLLRRVSARIRSRERN
jgi:stage IV sporulation protein FB